MPLDPVQRKLCSVCAHPEVAAIAAAVQRGDSLRQVGAAYGIDKSSLSRHMRQCLPAVSAASQAVNHGPMGHIVNGELHAEAVRLAAVLAQEAYMVNTLHGLRAAVALLVKLFEDEPEPDNRLR